jgi:septum site-determining protein MinC
MNTDSLALHFKSATLYAVRVVLHSADTERLTAALDKRMVDTGSFFENEPVVIDASQVEGPVDWPVLLEALRGHHLPPIGVVAEGDNLDAACGAGLTPVELSTPSTRTTATDASNAPPPLSIQTQATTTLTAVREPLPMHAAHEALPSPVLPQADPPSSSTLVISRPLRSGQRVYARHTDLIVIGMVSPGAEVIADGNIHIYGPLRGKAMAGAHGDTSARIFTTHLDAELLAIAGIYRVLEDRLDATLHGQPALVHLDGDTLRIEALKT